MKTLFLDHDGVICLSSEWGSRYKRKEKFDRFNKKAINTLNEIIQETNCEIVVSSDWRFHCTLEEMRQLYLDRGIIKPPIGYTKQFNSLDPYNLEQNRAAEILDWVTENKPLTFCAVDDLDMSRWLNEQFVFTPKENEGIKQLGIKEKIIKILIA